MGGPTSQVYHAPFFKREIALEQQLQCVFLLPQGRHFEGIAFAAAVSRVDIGAVTDEELRGAHEAPKRGQSQGGHSFLVFGAHICARFQEHLLNGRNETCNSFQGGSSFTLTVFLWSWVAA